MRSGVIALATCAALALTAPATAVTVYDNGLPNTVDGNDATEWVQAEDFSFGSATTITGAGVYLAGFDGIGTYDGGFQYYLFADGGGIPGAVLQTGDVSPVITDSGLPWCCGGNAYLFAFDFDTAFDADAGAIYYLGIHAANAGDFGRDDIYWVTTDLNATNPGVESDFGTFDNWFTNFNEHAFFLTGGDVVPDVPEASTWLMMIGGLAAAGAAMRRRRRVSVSFV